MTEKVTIIGGGISGITTGLVLQVLGIETEIYAEHLVGDKIGDARFASQYPAASVIPHSVQSPQLASLFSDSIDIFEDLYKQEFTGMKKHRHFEMFEFPVDEPGYTRYLDNYSLINENNESVPRRTSTEKLYGWSFNCYVAEWPAYIHQLYQLYQSKGGAITRKKVTTADIFDFSTDVIINCSGVWSQTLFADDAEPKMIRGHLIHVYDKPKVHDAQGRICSYNYTPKQTVYAKPDGDPCDVYFYPIGDKWLVGGSRQVGTLNGDGQWAGQEHRRSTEVDGIQVPWQIIELNKDILAHSYNISFQPGGTVKSFIGYRFERNEPQNGLRLEKVKEHGKTVVHNYGHGGAGVTLSWGCGLQVARLLNIDNGLGNIAEYIK